MISTGNTKIPSYLTIISKEYKVELEFIQGKHKWSASKNSKKYLANDLESLLGLITMEESRGKNWLATANEISDFFENFPELRAKK